MIKLLISPVMMILASFTFPFVYWPEMLNWPFIISRGWLPYRDFTTIHTPVLPITLAGFYNLLGFNSLVLHIFGTALLGITNFLLVFIAWKMTKSGFIALTVGLLHIFLVLTFEGNTVWFESLVAPLVLGAFYLRKGNPFWSGLLFGLAILTKQTAVYFLPLFLIAPNRRVFLFPVAFLLGVFFGIMYNLGIFDDFINWGIKFPLSLPSFSQPSVLPDLKLPTLRQGLILFLILLLSARKLSLLPWVTFALLFAFPRFEYFHLIVSVPFFLLTLAKKRSWLVLGVLIIILIPVFRNTYLLGNRFLTPEVFEVSDWLNQNVPEKTIFSLNGPDLVYFFTGREPAVRPWVDQLPWEMAYFGNRFVEEFKSDDPDVVVFRPYAGKPVDGLGAYQPKEVVDYVFSHYRVVKIFSGGVEIMEKI